MNKLAFALAGSMMLALAAPFTPATATVETFEAKSAASEAAAMARADMADEFGVRALKPGRYLWKDGVPVRAPRVVISLSDQMAYLYSANRSSRKSRSITAANMTMRRCPSCNGSMIMESRFTPAHFPAARRRTAASASRRNLPPSSMA